MGGCINTEQYNMSRTVSKFKGEGRWVVYVFIYFMHTDLKPNNNTINHLMTEMKRLLNMSCD